MRLGDRVGQQDPLPQRQTIGLDRASAIQLGREAPGLDGVAEDTRPRAGDAVSHHEVLGKRLR
jgi:hypothetical protein